MSNGKRMVRPDELGAALAEELTIYGEAITEAVDLASEQAAKFLVEITRATAPVGRRGSYRRHISYKELTGKSSTRGKTFAWYVKPPDHRLTHLLVNGHATKNGGRTKADPFLRKALDQVLPSYEQKVEEIVKDGN